MSSPSKREHSNVGRGKRDRGHHTSKPCSATYPRRVATEALACPLCRHPLGDHNEQKETVDVDAVAAPHIATLQDFVKKVKASVSKKFCRFLLAGEFLYSNVLAEEAKRQVRLNHRQHKYLINTMWPKDLDNIKKWERDLLVVGGESGCGKTMFMGYMIERCRMARQARFPRAATIKMYALAEQVFTGDYGEGDEGLQRAKANPGVSTTKWKEQDAQWCEERNADALRLLTKYLRKTLEVQKFTDRDRSRKSAVYLVLDEMGPFPRYLRALCVAAVREGLSEAIGVNVYIITGGTGCSSSATEPVGSRDSPFTSFDMPEWTPAVWKAIFSNEVVRIENDRTQARHYALGLLGNARSAVLLLSLLRVDGGAPIPDLMSAVVIAASRFRDRNALKTLHDKSIFGVLSHALFLVMSKHSKDLSTSREAGYTFTTRGKDNRRPYSEQDLATRFGIITDSEKDPAAKMLDGVQDDRGLPRYRLTGAQSVMFLVQYGLGTKQTATGEGFELSFKDYLVLVFTAAYFEHRGEAQVDLQQLVFPRPGPHATLDSGSIRMSSITGITVIDTDCQLQAVGTKRPTTQKAMDAAERLKDAKTRTLKRVAKSVGNREIVIVVNAPQAANADLMVFFPGGVWWSIQAKRYTTTTLNSLAAWEEISKMGYDKELPSAARGGSTITAALQAPTANAATAAADVPVVPSSTAGKACLATLVEKCALSGKETKPQFFDALINNDRKLTTPQLAVFAEKAASLHEARVAFAREVGALVFPCCCTTVTQIPCFVLGHDDEDAQRFCIPDGIPHKTVRLDIAHSSLYPIRPGYSTAGLKVSEFVFIK